MEYNILDKIVGFNKKFPKDIVCMLSIVERMSNLEKLGEIIVYSHKNILKPNLNYLKAYILKPTFNYLKALNFKRVVESGPMSHIVVGDFCRKVHLLFCNSAGNYLQQSHNFLLPEAS